MNRLIPLICALMAVFPARSQEGENLFQTHCSACHTIGGGRRVGPDLMKISERRDAAWVISFIQSSARMIKAGDPQAVAVFEEYNKIPMPDQPLNDQQARAVIEYIDMKGQASGEGVARDVTSQVPPDLLAGTTVANIRQGQLYFTGKSRFGSKGPSCIACHLVMDDRVFTSGTLAKDLTRSFELMGSAGVSAILKNPPFPVMAKAYENSPLTYAEITDLTAYLKSVSDQRIYQHPRDYSTLFGLSGTIVFILALAVIQALYFRRKKWAVNQEIFQRQSNNIH